MNKLRVLNDSELRKKLDECAVSEQQAMFAVVRVLAEFEDRRTYLGLGFSSSFEYLTKHLQYSEAAAVRRIRAARAARALPEVIQSVEAGEVSFSAIETCSELLVETGGKLVLEALKGKTIEEARLLKAAARPGSTPSRSTRDVITPIVSFSPAAQKQIAPKKPVNSRAENNEKYLEKIKKIFAHSSQRDFSKLLPQTKDLSASALAPVLPTTLYRPNSTSQITAPKSRKRYGIRARLIAAHRPIRFSQNYFRKQRTHLRQPWHTLCQPPFIDQLHIPNHRTQTSEALRHSRSP